MQQIDSFTIRVYGLLINSKKQVLLVHEKLPDMQFTKFPGGGLEFYEGPEECLIREFKEETDLDITIKEHIYTTGFFVQSAFKKNNQLLAIYYRVEPILNDYLISYDEKEITVNGKTEILRFFWADIDKLTTDILTFPVDKYVLENHLKNLV
ncbi:MAG: NUDIX hydrolase [Bacteroidia bacterium]